jgi:hypothetical protein
VVGVADVLARLYEAIIAGALGRSSCLWGTINNTTTTLLLFMGRIVCSVTFRFLKNFSYTHSSGAILFVRAVLCCILLLFAFYYGSEFLGAHTQQCKIIILAIVSCRIKQRSVAAVVVMLGFV